MKNYRFIVPIVLAVLLVISFYTLIDAATTTNEEYNEYLTKARNFAEKGITKYAIENYNCALEIKSTPEIYAEVATYYKSQDKLSEYLIWSEIFQEEYPLEQKAYEHLLDANLVNKDYEACFDVMEVAEKRGIRSDFIDSVFKEIQYVFSFDFNNYDNVSVYGNNYCAVQNKDRWGFVDRFGNVRIATKYVETGVFTQSAFVPVVNSKGECYFIDKTGQKVLVSDNTYVSFGSLVDGRVCAKLTDGKYTYLNENLEPLFGKYDYATAFNREKAAVKAGGNWSVIDLSGNVISSKSYKDIKLDEKLISYRNERLFVSDDGVKYYMIDSSGKKIGDLMFEDAKIFSSEQPAAVKINGKWSFIDDKGKLISDKKYDDARSFINGYAAVCINGKWGFVDIDENIVIEPQFFDAKDFTEKGSCFVNTGTEWQLLKLYWLNREG